MKELTREWIRKAENDYRSALVLLQKIQEPIVDTACFHCQQSAEKYLKGFLTEHQVAFPRRHPLIPLLELCLQIDQSFHTLLTDLRSLEGYAVAVRYPGATVTLEMAEDALETASGVRAFIRHKLGFPADKFP
jgi:HEPN domain-containing protein